VVRAPLTGIVLVTEMTANAAIDVAAAPIFPAEEAFEIDVETPDGRTLPLRSPEFKDVIEQRAGYAVTLRF
jgi:hypothetical protein